MIQKFGNQPGTDVCQYVLVGSSVYMGDRLSYRMPFTIRNVRHEQELSPQSETK